MAEKENLTDFMIYVLKGIGYGKLSPTNRAYNWIKNNTSLDGPCLNYLKNNISADNMITQKEMSMFKELEKKGDLPSEIEVNDLLEEYMNKTSDDVYSHIDLRYVENELRQFNEYCEAVELEEKFLMRQCNKLQDDINLLEARNKMDQKKIKSTLASVEEKSSEYDNITKDVQHDLSEITATFTNLLNENTMVEEHNIFRMNFETFKEINKAFCDEVNSAIQKQFNKVHNLESAEEKSVLKNESSDGRLVATNLLQDGQNNQIEELISIAECLGRSNYELLKWKCEETELNELYDYIENLRNSPEYVNISIARLKSQTDSNFDVTYDLQKKIINLSETLEEYFNDSVVKGLLVRSRLQLEHSLKSDRKCLKKISDLCTKFVNLMTLQACLSYKEMQNVDWTVESYNYGLGKLEEQLQKHACTMSTLRKMLQRQKVLEMHNERRAAGGLYSKSLDNGIDVEDISDSNKVSDNISALQNRLLSFIDTRLSEFFSLKSQLNDIDETIFNGPMNQPFFSNSLLNDEILLAKQYITFSDRYRLWKAKYNEELEKLNVDDYDKLQRTLGLMFLTDPESLRNNFQRLKKQVSENNKFSKTMSSTTTAGAGDFSSLPMKNNISS